MIIRAELKCKQTGCEADPCAVDKVIELPSQRFRQFSRALLADYDFIAENKNAIRHDDDARHCLLILDAEGTDGFLVDPQGHNYARYSAFVPNARSLLTPDMGIDRSYLSPAEPWRNENRDEMLRMTLRVNGKPDYTLVLPADEEYLDAVKAYALRYTYRFNPNSETTDYYYLIYVPGGGDVDRRGFGYSTGLFSTAFKLELEGTNDQDGLYCVMTTSKKAAPQLRVTLNGKRLEDEITVVDFNPTLYTIASESDYSMLTNAAGDLYLEQLEKEMEPDLVAITVVEDGQGVATGEFDAPDFLLNTVTGIHELHYLEEYPFSLENFQLSDYFTLSVHYADTTGEAHYEDTSNYLIVETESAWYLIEIGPNSVIEKILEEGQITSRDDVLVYEISEDAYSELANLFDKTT